MKKFASLLVLLGLGVVPALAATTAFNNVSVVDVGCSKKAATNPDAHTRSCALACARSGYGILTSNGQFLKFDATGNREIKKELEASHEKDHLRVNVKGEVQGSTLKVSSVSLL
ncbi:MAG TPA: hypothetical protein VGT04_17010 [Acidobacteriaceae bacterium]|nr:hypothetical protein [Acidobacteriaceae bacterium]